MAIQWLGAYTGEAIATKRIYDLLLGKMIQPSATSTGDIEVEYVNSASVQWNSVTVDPEKKMWASSADVRNYSVTPGDLMICEGGDVGRAAIYEGPPGRIFQNSVHRARSYQGSDVRYLKYLLIALHGSGWLDLICNKATIAHFTAEKLGALAIPRFDTDEQQRIANFLDNETTRIDRVLADQLRMIEVLNERRICLTSLLVYGRNQTGAKMKFSVPSIGEVPSTWGSVRIKTFMRETTDLSATGCEELLSVSHLTGVTPRSEKEVNMFLAESMVGYKRCKPGDLVINTLWAWMGALGISRFDGIVSPAYGTYRLTSDLMDPNYLDLLVRTPEYVTEMTRFSKGVWSSRLRLYPDSFLSLTVPLPTRTEQRQIVKRIENETSGQENLKAALKSFADKLAERKQALITAAVTGEITV